MEYVQREGSPAKKPRTTLKKRGPHSRLLYLTFSLRGKTSQEPECQPSNVIKTILDKEKKNPPTYICAALDVFPSFLFHVYLEFETAVNVTTDKRFAYIGLGEHLSCVGDPDLTVKGNLLQQIKGGKLPCDIYPPLEAEMVGEEIRQENEYNRSGELTEGLSEKDMVLTKQQRIFKKVSTDTSMISCSFSLLPFIDTVTHSHVFYFFR